MKHFGLLPIGFFLALFCQFTNAATYQSHKSIQEAIHLFLMAELSDNGDEITIKVGKLDPRLRLAQCGDSINISLPSSSRRVGGVTVKVACESGVSWAIYVQNEVERFGMVVVAKRGLSRGALISREDIGQRRVSLGTIRGGYVTNIEDVLNWEVKKNIPTGNIISPNFIRRPILVKRGDVVVIIVKSDQFEVKMSGIAKSSGAKGETVQVINKSSKKVVEGVVIGPGVVQVPM